MLNALAPDPLLDSEIVAPAISRLLRGIGPPDRLYIKVPKLLNSELPDHQMTTGGAVDMEMQGWCVVALKIF
jgi:hypothetical protein